MVNLSSTAALDVAIGLFFVFLVLSIVCSAVNETIAMALNLRGRELEKGIRRLLADRGAAEKFYANWRIRQLSKPKLRGRGDRKPSYLPSRTFAVTLLDTVAPPGEDAKSRDLIERAEEVVEKVDNPQVRALLADALADARGDVDRFRRTLERSFDDVMERTSGWYKRRVHWMLIAIAALLVGAINADSFQIGQRLWKDDALRAVVVQRATEQVSATSCSQAQGETTKTPPGRAAVCVDEIEQLGIPLGWKADTTPDDFGEGLGKLAGLLATVFALSFGAPFWFDLLGKVSRLRGTGLREEPAAPRSSADSPR